MAPLVLAAGIVLTALAPSPLARLAAVVYALTSLLLFSVSAIYHRGTWTARVHALLRRLDHSNIYLIIAGTYTPIALLAMSGGPRIAVLTVVWTGAILGVVFRLFWLNAPRWLYTPLYVGLGWVAVFVFPQLLTGGGIAAFVLVLAGGLAYTVGGLVYALKRPRLSPRWFGFHEVFHACTVVGYTAQYIAVSFVTYSLV
ncbi:MAG: hemolysin III family protein [Streptosporangiales bacterium]|nr:hemolysin III family protein [Streptosporangiales bacterium]